MSLHQGARISSAEQKQPPRMLIVAAGWIVANAPLIIIIWRWFFFFYLWSLKNLARDLKRGSGGVWLSLLISLLLGVLEPAELAKVHETQKKEWRVCTEQLIPFKLDEKNNNHHWHYCCYCIINTTELLLCCYCLVLVTAILLLSTSLVLILV